MKKYLLLCLFVLFGFMLISWGILGHHVVGEIAENHLTPEAKAGVQELLGHQSLADVSSWADDIRQDYPETGSWHFVNLPLGLSFPDFEKQVQSMQTGNVYNSILRCVHDLKDNNTSQRKKVEALKFLVHFVGDAHQPMHVSRAEDKGGNTIMLTYNNEYTNLHSIWDSKLLEQDGYDYKKLAVKYDKATPEQIKKWQSDPVIIWIWESYLISSMLYAEADTLQNKPLGKAYYERHIPIVENRLEKAGIRLAGVLNYIYKK
ncbi:S1/P1 nuclease [Mucilaginibacter sp.]